MNQKTRNFIREWGIPLAIFLILYVTGWYKPVVSFAQRMVLSTGLIKPDTELVANDSYGKTDYQWTLQTLDGQPVPFDAFRGKVVFLNFFATWCPPCIAEMPGIQSLYEQTATDDIAFIILSRDDSRETVKRFMEKKEYDLPVYMAAGPTPAEFQSRVIPTTYIISPRGEIVSVQSGMADYDNDKVKTFLNELTQRL